MPVGARRVLVSGRGSGPGFSLTAPVLAFVDPVDPDSDTTPDMFIDLHGLPSGVYEDYVLRLIGTNGSATVTSTHDVDISHTITALEDAALEITLASTPAAPDGLIARNAYMELPGGGTRASPDSNTVSKTIITTSKLLLAAGGTDNILLVDGSSNLLLAA